MKKAFFILLFVLKFQLIYSQSSCPVNFDWINSINLIDAIEEMNLLSQSASISIGFNENYDTYNRYGLNRFSEKKHFNVLKQIRQVVQPQKSDINEFKIKMNGLLDKSKIDLLFKHSFNTRISFVILYVPIGKKS
jgi:hypothetical protein